MSHEERIAALETGLTADLATVAKLERIRAEVLETPPLGEPMVRENMLRANDHLLKLGRERIERRQRELQRLRSVLG